MPIYLFMLFATFNGALAVGLGAFGAHALKQSLSPGALQTWHTAVQYQFIHVLALLALALCLKVFGINWAGKWAGISFMLGILFFCGSLYWLAVGGPRWLGPITPLGGLLFITGWVLFSTFIATHAKTLNP